MTCRRVKDSSEIVVIFMVGGFALHSRTSLSVSIWAFWSRPE